MGKFCKECGKIMRLSKMSHCSDECLFTSIKDSKSLSQNSDAEQWGEESDPWI